MNSKKKIPLLKWVMMLAVLFMGTNTFAQQLKVTGKVIDETGMGFPGVNIIIKGTSTGTATDVNGNFTLNIEKGKTLQFSFIGYKPQDIRIMDKTDLKIKMESQSETLDEIVVTGYGQSRKSDLTGSVASVSAEGLADFKTSSVVEALGGQVAGVQVTQVDGAPGSGFDIKIRGIGSINSDTGPMYVVDGFQVDNIDYLANADIASMEILKDASASAIYGARAANGVVLITTKSGSVGKPTISYSGSANYRTISRKLDVLSPYEFVKLQMELDPVKFGNTYYQEGLNDKGEPYRYQSLEDYRNVGGVDWQDEVFSPTWSQDHNVSIQGGTKATRYNISYSNYSEDGLFKNSSFAKNTAKIRLTQEITQNINFDATINYVNTLRKGVSTSADGGRFNMLAQILGARPTGGLRVTDEELLHEAIDPLFLDDGSSLAQVNPIKQAESVTNDRRGDMWQANASFTWEIIKGLTFKTAASYRQQNTRIDIFYNEDSRQAIRNGGKAYGETQMQRSLSWTNYNYLTYEKKIKKHRFGIMVGQELNFNQDEMLRGQSKDFPFDYLGNANLGLGAVPSIVETGYSDKKLLSFFSRVNYNFAERYLITATVRTDGSTVFSQANKWALAPSFSFAWRVSEEKFMKDNISWISNLKFRAGWGILGNDRIQNYLSLPLYSDLKYGVGSETVSALVPKQKPNPNLKWEGSTTTNVGIDLGLFSNRLTITADAFLKDTKDLLMQKSLPFVTGFSYQWQNVGSIRNKGIELSLHSVNLTTEGGFQWTTDFNISFIRNTLKKLQPGENYVMQRSNFDSNFTANDYIAIVGQPLGLMYGYVQDGLYQPEDFIQNGVTGGQTLRPGQPVIKNANAKDFGPGFVKYKDISGPNGVPDGVIDDNDRTVIGNGTPDYFGGFTNNFSYKGFDLNIMFQYSVGNDVYNANALYNTQSHLERTNKLGEVANRWTPTNMVNDVPKAKGQVTGDIYSRFIENGSFLRLKNITLGYSLPKQVVNKFHCQSLRLYASAQNLFVVSNYSGYDPEVNMRSSNPMTPGFDFGAYPRSKVFTFGLDVKF